MNLIVTDLGNQDGLLWMTGADFMAHVHAVTRLAKGVGLGAADGPIVMGMGEGNRVIVARGAGLPDRRHDARRRATKKGA
jgi:hypothetical protein